MSEYNLRRWTVQSLAPLHAVAVENPACPGTPDINTVLGWIELKHVERAPKRKNTPVRLTHYTPQQRLWSRRRAGAGGLALMFLQVGQHYLLLNGTTAADYVGCRTLEELEEVAEFTWHKKPTPQELLEALISLYRPWDHSCLLRARIFASSDDAKTGG